ncbi:MAG: rhodanese-like domain-containing protein [Planctomycetota bacterium]
MSDEDSLDEDSLEISCQEVHARLTVGDSFVLLDCRETHEHTVASIAQARLVPMSEIATRVESLADLREHSIVVLCHHGMRSAQVAMWLRGQGFSNVKSMAGGIDRWSEEIDPSIPRY